MRKDESKYEVYDTSDALSISVILKL